MSFLAALEPQPLWSYFEELTRIPRESKNEAAAIAWLLEKGRQIGCEVEFRPLSAARLGYWKRTVTQTSHTPT